MLLTFGSGAVCVALTAAASFTGSITAAVFAVFLWFVFIFFIILYIIAYFKDKAAVQKQLSDVRQRNYESNADIRRIDCEAAQDALPANLKSRFPIKTDVADFDYQNNEILKKLKPNDSLTIFHNPGENLCEEAEVIIDKLNEVLGHLEKDLNAQLVYQFGDHFKLSGKILKITGNLSKGYACSVLIYGNE